MPISIKEKFLKSTAVVSIFTMLSRIFGYIRDALMFIFISNASGALDAFFVAFRIPNFFRRIFGEGALSTAYIPVLSDYKNKDDQKEVKRIYQHIYNDYISDTSYCFGNRGFDCSYFNIPNRARIC